MIVKWIKQERFFVLQRSARYATWWYTMGQKAPRKSLLSQKLLKDSHKQYSIKNFLWNPMKNYTKGPPIYPLNIDLNDPKIVNLAHCAINGHLAWHARVHEHLVLHYNSGHVESANLRSSSRLSDCFDCRRCKFLMIFCQAQPFTGQLAADRSKQHNDWRDLDTVDFFTFCTRHFNFISFDWNNHRKFNTISCLKTWPF